MAFALGLEGIASLILQAVLVSTKYETFSHQIRGRDEKWIFSALR